MRHIATIATVFLAACTLSGCNRNASNHDADVSAIQSNEDQWNQDFAAKDADKLVAHYSPDAVLMVPGTAPASGTDAIRNSLKPMLADPALSLQFKASQVDVASSGDLAYTRGTYTLTMTDPQTKQVMHDHGSYVTDYRKQPDGSWKAVADIVMSEVPPPAPAAAPAPTTKKKMK
jgi:uncharacterized protein (TIGR02246 family)